jgi:Leucine-rich repeat (LRR) protein
MKMKSTLFCLVFALCANTCITAYAQAVNKQDSLALVDLYKSTNGPAWRHNNNWLTGPVRTWIGITVTGTRITAINLRENNLEGNIPASIGNLVNLTLLWLTQNHLSGSIPSSIGNLVNITRFWLNKNQLNGSIPSSIGNLVKLKDLDLSENQLSGSIPSSIGNLVNLNNLYLDANQLSGSIPSSIGNLVKLFFLSLGDNKLSGSIPAEIGKLINLAYLWIYSNQLSGSIPASLSNIDALYWLSLSNNKLSSSIPASLCNNHRNLLEVDLQNNQLSGSIPDFLPGNHENLTYLYLYNNHLSGTIPSSISNLINLQELNLSHNKLSGIIPSTIANLHNLSLLDLSYNHYTFNSMQFVEQTFPFALYDNQALIPVHQNGNALFVSAGGTLKNNTYKWFKVGQTGNTTIKGDSVFHPLQSGKYFTSVINSIATGLVLKSDTINYAASSLSNATGIASKENAQQESDKISTFSVYPNPAKNILHVQTNGNASFSLLDQSGQILLTSNIKGEGNVNVSNIAAGLYYLRNNNSGAAQKVIIVR